MSVTIASLQSHGVSQLLVYCFGKREGGWSCHHRGTLPIDRFRADQALPDIQRRCRCTVCGWRQADPPGLQQATGCTAERWMDDAATGQEIGRSVGAFAFCAGAITTEKKKYSA